MKEEVLCSKCGGKTVRRFTLGRSRHDGWYHWDCDDCAHTEKSEYDVDEAGIDAYIDRMRGVE